MSYLKTLESSGFTTKLLASETDFEITGTFFFWRMKHASLINQKRLNQLEQHKERLVVYHWNYYFVLPISSSLEEKKKCEKFI